MKTITITPIGKVHANDSTGTYQIEIAKPYRDGLFQLSEFGRVNVLWWAHRADEPKQRLTLKCDLPYAPNTQAGVFACRSEYRPNPVGLTPCGIIEIQETEGIVVVDYIDAMDGTPVMDLKPYIPVIDRARELKVPVWFRSWPEWIEDGAAFFANENAPKTR